MKLLEILSPKGSQLPEGLLDNKNYVVIEQFNKTRPLNFGLIGVDNELTNNIEFSKQNWSKIKLSVEKLQSRIYRASRSNNFKTVNKLQDLMIRSHESKLLAIWQITHVNKGRKTPGVDEYLPKNNIELNILYNQINFKNYSPIPVKRIYIPKPNGKLRPLGIPSIMDRIMQLIVKFALEPEWEAKFEPNSYGFRPGRCTMDAICAIWKVSKGTSWFLDADITGCFDNISHDSLLQRIPKFASIIRLWLKSGYLEYDKYHNTDAGTPQGGVISPLLANIALDGLERLFGCFNSRGNYSKPRDKGSLNKRISLIRYADDFVVSAPDKERIEQYILPKISLFLKERGLSLNLEKPRIVHLSDGFDFLGFTIRKFKNKLITQPKSDNIKRMMDKVRKLLDQYRSMKTVALITKLKPIFRGWANYYRYCNASKTFSKIDHLFWLCIYPWCVRRHPNKGKRWIVQKYFHTIGNNHWVFGELVKLKSGKSVLYYLPKMAWTTIERFVQVRILTSPFDRTQASYWIQKRK